MYLHSVPALKMVEKSNKHRFWTRFDRFGGDGDKLNNFQDRSVLYLSMKFMKYDSLENF